MITLKVIREALEMLGDKYTGLQAEIMLLAIGYQESSFLYRKQIKGPARGFWQFEIAGIAGVMSHPATRKQAERIAQKRKVNFKALAIHTALEHDDILAACYARLLLYTDPRPLPYTEDDAWDYYIRNWRPGKPHKHRWPKSWKFAVQNAALL